MPLTSLMAQDERVGYGPPSTDLMRLFHLHRFRGVRGLFGGFLFPTLRCKLGVELPESRAVLGG